MLKGCGKKIAKKKKKIKNLKNNFLDLYLVDCKKKTIKLIIVIHFKKKHCRPFEIYLP